MSKKGNPFFPWIKKRVISMTDEMFFLLFHRLGINSRNTRLEVIMRNIHIVHKSNEKMRCVFNSVVIRNDSLNSKYPGGLKGFFGNHPAISNNDITVCISMGAEIDEVIDDILSEGLSDGSDFAFVDAGGFAISFSLFKKNQPQDVDVGVDWLKARYAEGGVWVWYVG
jgi:hypothetical protein